MSQAALACKELIKCCHSGKRECTVHEQDNNVRTCAIACAKNKMSLLESKLSFANYVQIKLIVCPRSILVISYNLGNLIQSW